MKSLRLVWKIIILSLLICCGNKNYSLSSFVNFNVGFEEIKTHQGIHINPQNGEEEVFFVKTEFNPHIKFFDLSGNVLDSISLKKVERDIGRIGRISLVSKDSIVIISYSEKRIAAINSIGDYWFNLSLDSLAAYQDNEFSFYGSVAPSGIFVGNDLILLSYWDGDRKENQKGILESFTTEYEYYSYFYSRFIKAPILCKVENVFSGAPLLQFGMENYFYNLSPLLKPYYTGARYFIVNDKVFFFSLFDRYLYEVDIETLEIKNKIYVITEEYEIPESIVITEENSLLDTTPEEKEELRENCYMTNMLYSERSKEYYVFVKIGRDNSYIDEWGYPFKILVFNEEFIKQREFEFSTDEYAPQTAMMSSRGIMIEQIKKEEEYGKKTFRFLEI